MNKTLENLYHSLPPLLQHTAVSAYGVVLYNQRYGQPANRFLQSLRHTESLDRHESLKLQEVNLIRLAQHAITTVPYYRRWATREGVEANDLQSISDLQSFPILSKDQIRSHTKDLVSDKFRNSSKLIKLQTSGTTGSPLDIYCTKNERKHHYAFFSRLRSWFGLRPRSRRATFLGRIIMLPTNNHPPFWRHDIAQNNLILSAYHLSDRNLPHYYEKLRRYQPEELFGYPSAMFALADFIERNGLPHIPLRLVMPTAETLLPFQRQTLESVFECPVVDQYGCAEMAVFASQCEHGTMHVHPEHGLLETVDHCGQPTLDEPGRAVVTGLVNWTMPLIRYDIGDFLSLTNYDCLCGRSFPVITGLEGRVDDIIYRADGTPITRLSPVFKGNFSIKEAQVIQREPGKATVHIVADGSFDDTDRNWLAKEMHKRTGDDFELSIRLVQSIPRTKKGKFRAVINLSNNKNRMEQ